MGEPNVATQFTPNDFSLPFTCFAEWLVAPVRLVLLQLAIDLELPDILQDTGDPAGIAARLAEKDQLQAQHTVDEHRLAYVLDALAAAGLLYKQNGAYANTPLAETYLRKNSPAYLGGMIAMLRAMQHRNLTQIKPLLYGEQPQVREQNALRGEDHWRHSLRGLIQYQKAGAAEALAGVAASLPGAAGFRRMLDLGCGPGITALRILQKLPELRVVLCDFPNVLDMARTEAESAGLAARVDSLPGDYNQADFGQGYDLVWACQSLYYARDLSHFLKKIHDALRPGGFFVSIHEGICAEGTQPSQLVLSRLSLALEGQDVSFSAGQIAAAAVAAGFSTAGSSGLELLYGRSELEIFQKNAGCGEQ